MIKLVRLYQLTLSPFIGNQCRFAPTCSNYSIEALEKHGAVKGSWLTLKRLGRCHPGCEGGCDPVPEVNSEPKKLQS
ncbi:membrane protein insertion efficiency factor YidD [Kangiella sp. TOML190]|uniref:membrane protein insertion efficiency factor YidD n=1 Tax=Kangiella sp. TOML190 TaxID=2931351 RepID=UPI0035DBEE98